MQNKNAICLTLFLLSQQKQGGHAIAARPPLIPLKFKF